MKKHILCWPFDDDWCVKTCPKCGRAMGWYVHYSASADRLVVDCRVCNYRYEMAPKIESGVEADEK